MSSMITFDYSIRPMTVQRDRQSLDIGILDEKGLRKIGKGRIIVLDHKKGCFFIVESQVLDYANQLMGVIAEFDRGNYDTFAVSPDFFSNNLKFKLDSSSKQIEVCEVNAGLFRLQFSYKQFKQSLNIFYAQLMEDLQLYYPELTTNKAFLRMRPS